MAQSLTQVFRGLFLTSLCLSICGCSADDEQTSEARRFHLDDFVLTIQDSPPRIDVAREGRHVAEIRGEDFAFRKAAANYEMLLGSFRIEETPEGDWRRTARLSGAEQLGNEVRVGLEDGGGSIFGQAVLRVPDTGHLFLEVTPTEAGYNRSLMAMDCAEVEHFVGLGSQAADVDHYGQNVPLFVSEPGIGKADDDEYPALWFIKGTKHAAGYVIPAFIASRGAAFLLDSHARNVFNFCEADSTKVSLESWENGLAFHVFDGPTPLEALERMTSFTGRPWMPPPWAFAPWNDAKHGPENVMEFARFLRDNEIPTSAIWSEDFRGGIWTEYGYRIGPNWRADPELYPDLEGLIADLRALGIVMQLYYNPHVIEKADVAEEVRGLGLLLERTNGEPYLWDGADGTFGQTGMLDLTKPEARQWAKNELKKAIAMGSRGWMADYGEWMPIDDAAVASGENPEIVHNEYPILWQRISREAMEEAGVKEDMCVFHRSGHLGSQRETLIAWAGDQRTSFEADDGLPSVVPIGLGLAATGFPFYAHDIAGYQFVTNSAPVAVTKELFFRWTELGAWTPVMRTHRGIKVEENWALQSDAETTEMWKRYASLHVQLYPYWRGLAVRAVQEGRPLWIPMGFLHPEEHEVWGIRDQFYVGDAVLVAPVLTEGATSRSVVFPTRRFAPMMKPGIPIIGPTTQTIEAPVDQIPVFIGAGGLVPMTKEPAMTLLPNIEGIPGLESTTGHRLLYVGLGASGSFVEEDGATYTLEGEGTDGSALGLDAEGGLEIVGNGSVQGGGFSLQLSGHPSDRVTYVRFR